MTSELSADYLVVGAGAMGMAFTDVLLNETDASVILVDRYHQPGGHWTTAYPFVRLHQPSAFYGVNSKHLGNDVIDETGWNKGFYELATNGEVCAYFDQVMQRQFLPSGRVDYYPSCQYDGDGRFHSLISGNEFVVSAGKIVDATYMNVTVPSMRAPSYEVADGVACVPVNGLPKAGGDYARYVVIGAGKTGMDACLFLLRNGTDPDRISWVMPRDSWMLDRANIQPGVLADSVARGFAMQLVAIANAETVDAVFDGVEQMGQLIRFDANVRPTMYRCATVTQAELEQMRRINDVIRLGRVQHIEADRIVLDEGEVPTSADTLHVDCSADGLEKRPAVPIFDGAKITLQSVRTCQQVFSAAFLGHLEATYETDEQQNQLATPVPHPDSELDFLRTTLINGVNSAKWLMIPELQAWLADARLDGFTSALAGQETEAQQQTLKIVMENATPAQENLARLLAEADG